MHLASKTTLHSAIKVYLGMNDFLTIALQEACNDHQVTRFYL